jgi:hypothetical protein
VSAELYVGEATTTQRRLYLPAEERSEMAQVIPLRTAGTGYEGEREVDEAIANGTSDVAAIDSRFRELAGLTQGWLDGEGAPLATAALEGARATVAELLRREAPVPRLYPTLEGGVQAEWAVGDYEISLTFEPDGRSYALVVNRDSGESRELENDDTSGIVQFLQRTP